jgi:HlyD family secretion protein
MQVRAAVDEADIGNVQKGQRVSFTVDAFPEDVFNGTLQEIRLQPSISSNVVTYATIINAPNDQLKLKPGMTANSTIYTKEENNALVISAKATKFKPDSSMMKKYTIVDDRKQRSGQQKNNGATDTKYSGKPRRDSLSADTSSAKRASVWVLNGNTLTRRFIRIGLEDGTQVQVLSGLTENDVVVDGVQQAGAKANQSNVRSPFLPQRRTQTGSGNRQGGGNRPSQ